jgi:N-acetyl-anhydromuramyl-L-alanine amidase AmpD
MSADYGEAQWLPTTHFWEGRGGHQPRWLVLHATAGGSSAAAIAQWFQVDEPPTSAHYIVGRAGEIVQCVREADSAWANGVVSAGHDPWWSPALNPNWVTLSIEHVKPDHDNASPLTPAQQAASFRLIAALCDKYAIPKRPADATGGIAAHASIDPVNRAHCPGNYPWAALWSFLQAPQASQASQGGAGPDQARGSGSGSGSGTVSAASTSTSTSGSGSGTSGSGSGGGGLPAGGRVPAGWRDDGTQLVAPNGQVVVRGFRWYVLTQGWAADNWPLERESYVAQLDLTQPQLGAGTLQHFQRSVLGWQAGTSRILELPAGALALAWQQRATACEQSHQALPAAAATPTATAGTTAQPLPAPPPLSYVPPLPKVAGAAAGLGALLSAAGAASAGGSGQDPVGQRLSNLEQQVSQLLAGLGMPSTLSSQVSQVEQDLAQSVQALGGRKGLRAWLSNPKALLRLVLMLVGLLFSNAIGWAVSAFLHNSTPLPIPFLTVGTVLASGLVFMGVFRGSVPRHP